MLSALTFAIPLILIIVAFYITMNAILRFGNALKKEKLRERTWRTIEGDKRKWVS